MNPSDQRIAIATARGYSEIQETAPERGSLAPRWIGTYMAKDGVMSRNFIPNYLSDLNSCHEMEKVLNHEQQMEYIDWMCRTIVLPAEDEHGIVISQKSRAWIYLHATAAQRCEAFLKTLNLWRE